MVVFLREENPGLIWAIGTTFWSHVRQADVSSFPLQLEVTLNIYVVKNLSASRDD